MSQIKRAKTKPPLAARCGAPWGGAVVAILLLAAAVAAYAATKEGWDPFVQITLSKVKPNAYLTIDKSGSMKQDMQGVCIVGDDWVGGWIQGSAAPGCGMSVPGPQPVNQYWYYKPPSRWAVMKNLLGDSVSISEAPPGYAPYQWYSSSPALVKRPPWAIISATAQYINWGLITFSTDNKTCGNFEGGSQFTINPANNAPVVAAINGALRLDGAGGLATGAGDTTQMIDAYTQAVNGEFQATYAKDPRPLECGGQYYEILVTDGESDCGNPGNLPWASCPLTWTSYATNNIDQLFTKKIIPARVRTFAIGLGDSVGPCEVNQYAYRGRTDASSPNGDGGLQLDVAGNPVDPRLPPGAFDPIQNYAYFAKDSASLVEAFGQIISFMMAGDYTTAQPVVSSGGTTGGQITYIGSTEVPPWKGHLYAFDISKPPTDPPAYPYLVWEAGQKLEQRDLATNPRKIFTWDGGTNLVPVDAAHLSALQVLEPSITAQVVDFIQGKDGGGVKRPWILGPIVNSTVTLVTPPPKWRGSSAVPVHYYFEKTYQNRHPLLYVGSSDGMLHAFDTADGEEIYAILPPNLLSAQTGFYNYYISSGKKAWVGEPALPNLHVYGVASSPRVADVYSPSPSDKQYHTMLYLTEGKGGSLIAGIDITHPYPGRGSVTLPDSTVATYPPDPSYDAAKPVKIAWFQTAGGLGASWSVPSVGAIPGSGYGQWACTYGSGFNVNSSSASQVSPYLFTVDAMKGTPIPGVSSPGTLANKATPAPVVGNQAYGATILFNPEDPYYLDNNTQWVAVQADLNGQVWMKAVPSATIGVGIDAGAIAGNTAQPIYYNPAVGAHKGKNIYAFASGNLYETSAAVQNGTFRARLFIVVKSADIKPVDPLDPAKVWSVRITDLPNGVSSTLGDRAQVTADPFLIIPADPASNAVKALFSIYDPDIPPGKCYGSAYVALVTADPGKLGTAPPAATVTYMGEGILGGFSVVGSNVVVAKSGVGGGKVTVGTTGITVNPNPQPPPEVKSWSELH